MTDAQQADASDEPRYTLDEARRVIARQTCAMRDHDYEIIASPGHGPTTIICSRCGESWDVEGSQTSQELEAFVQGFLASAEGCNAEAHHWDDGEYGGPGLRLWLRERFDAWKTGQRP